MFLKPLRRQLEDMEQYDFTEIEKILPALMHTIGLIWANSKFYCRPSRIIVLLQEMCNMLIEMVSNEIGWWSSQNKGSRLIICHRSWRS